MKGNVVPLTGNLRMQCLQKTSKYLPTKNMHISLYLHSNGSLLFPTLFARQNRPRQTVQILIRLLLKNQSDQGPPSLLF